MEFVKIRAGTSNAYLIVNGEKSVLIDAGNKGMQRIILNAINKSNLKPSDIALIILTHTHFDHTGGLKKMKEHCNAKIIVHEKESRNLAEGYTIIPLGTSFPVKILAGAGRIFFPWISKYPAVHPDIIVQEEYEIDLEGIRANIIHTPGHTEGSVSIIFADVAFVGDTMMGITEKKAFPHFANDIPLLMKSWQKLLNLGCTEFYPGHGNKITKENLVKDLEKRLRLWQTDNRKYEAD